MFPKGIEKFGNPCVGHIGHSQAGWGCQRAKWLPASFNPITLCRTRRTEPAQGLGGLGSRHASDSSPEKPVPSSAGTSDSQVFNVHEPLSLHSVVVATPEQVSCGLGDESAILNMKNSVYYGINAVGTRVWNLIGEPRSIIQLRDTLLEEYEVDLARCEKDLLQLLEQMRAEGLIEVRNAASA
jgi:hypothetical protein